MACDVLPVAMFFLEVIMLFSWKGGVNFYIFLWNAKFMQETLHQESNENMYCHNLWWAASSIQD